MGLSFFDRLRPYVSRSISAIVGGIAGVASAKLHISVDPVTQASIAGAVTTGVYGVLHKVIDKKVNPGDSASAHLAVSEKSEAKSLKAR